VFVCLSVYQSVCVIVSVFVGLSVGQSVCRPVGRSVCIFVCLRASVCLNLSVAQTVCTKHAGNKGSAKSQGLGTGGRGRQIEVQSVGLVGARLRRRLRAGD